ncbi:tetratricopeptide repeat protein [Ancylothrix sp. C2]|uniref:tetratricopeptide repeat protein n=1 Tax=Ancylothrix sp. D3o TaxID=2953691 RepID=UPI0021BBA3FE|nr:tetratricopeptide repeat protein [Ancylothrix sp. D3o]MCT7952225.1 tetratricopeptide repeat protein [Ancylothrix sp. D3o]
MDFLISIIICLFLGWLFYEWFKTTPLGSAFLEARKQEKIFSSMVEAMNEVPISNLEDLERRALFKALSGDHQGAIEDYSQILYQDPNNTTAYLNRGNSRYLIGDYRGALQDYNLLIGLDAQYASGYVGRSNAKRLLGDYRGAVADCDQAIRINPNDDNAYVKRGLARLKLGDRTGAIQDFDRALKINPQNVEAVHHR